MDDVIFLYARESVGSHLPPSWYYGVIVYQMDGKKGVDLSWRPKILFQEWGPCNEWMA